MLTCSAFIPDYLATLKSGMPGFIFDRLAGTLISENKKSHGGIPCSWKITFVAFVNF